MARKAQDNTPPRNETILTQPMEEVMHNSMIPYAEYVILDRALPRVEDGLKPVQRRILYTMHELTLSPDKPHRKCARIVGDCLGKYHPHGDTSVYDALVRLAQDFSMRMPLVDGHGNFGSIDGDSAAAMRYTEARMKPLALEMLRDLEKDTVPFEYNFDDTLKEPTILPSSFPNLLVNGASGIAVGYATNIPPHNLGEVIDGVLAQIKKPKITTRELMEYVKGPDFPTGGEIIQSDEIEKAYETGRGRIQVRAKCSIEKGKAGKKLIVIEEMPYQVSKAALLEKISRMAQERKEIKGDISDVRDESDRTGIRGVIELRKDADAEKVLAFLYKYTDMQKTIGVNIMAIADGKPKQLSLKEANRYYIQHRKNVVTRRTKFDLEKAKAREHILAGLIIAIDNIDEVIRIIRRSKNPTVARDALMKRFSLSQIQAQAILDMRLQRLTALQIEDLRKEYAQILKTIKELEGILASEKKLLKVIENELLEVKENFKSKRRTSFIAQEGVKQVTATDFAVVEDVIVTMSAAGYLKRLPEKQGSKLKADRSNTKESDIILYSVKSSTDKRILIVTNHGNCYRADVADVPDGSKAKERGKQAGTLCGGFEKGETAISVFAAPNEDAEGDIVFLTKNGIAKRSKLSDYVVRSKKFAGINLKDDDEVIDSQVIIDLNADATVLLITKQGMSINVSLDAISVTGRTTAGVRAITLQEKDTVLFAKVVYGEGEIVLMTDRGYGKRILVADFELQGRNGKGSKVFPFKAGGMIPGSEVVGAIHVTEPVQISIVQKKTGITEINSEAVPIQLRTSKGSPIVMSVLDDVVTGIL